MVRNKHRALSQAARSAQWNEFEAAADMADAVEEAMRTLCREIASESCDHEQVDVLDAAEIGEAGPLLTTGGSVTTCEPLSDVCTQISSSEGLRPSWADIKWSRICKSFIDGTECPHIAKGQVCSFAHSVDELDTGLKICGWGRSCNRQYGVRPCCCRHPGTVQRFETVSEVISRMNLTKPLPQKADRGVLTIGKSGVNDEIQRLKDENFALRVKLAQQATRFLTIDVNAPMCSEKEWNIRAFKAGMGWD